MMNTKIKIIILTLFVLIGASGILLVSISRASLEIMKKEDREGRLRTEPVIINDLEIYKLPQSRMLPSNVFYWLKEIRDWIWQKFSPDEEDKITVMLILADKKISESRTLFEKEKYGLAFINFEKAIEKLEKSEELAKKITDNNIFKNETLYQIKKMLEVYEKIIEEMGKSDKIDKQKYLLLLQKINALKEKEI